MNGTRFSYRFGEFTAPCTGLNRSADYQLANEVDPRSGGVMTVQQATSGAVNCGYLAMAIQLNLCGIIDTATSLGIHRAGGASGDGPFQVLPANVLGSDSVAPMTMAAAFAAFAAGDTVCSPVAILTVTEADGNLLPVPGAGCHQALDPQIANAVAYALSGVCNGTANTSAPSFAAAGTTGTPSRNEHTWFAGFAALRATAVWVGHAEGMAPMQQITITGQTFRNVCGSSVAVPTWKRFMERTLSGTAVPAFGAPDPGRSSASRSQCPRWWATTRRRRSASISAAGFPAHVVGAAADSAPAGTGTAPPTSADPAPAGYGE